MAKLKHLELPNGSNYDIYGVNVQEISYDDYEALTPTQKNSDIAYCITDTPYEVDDSIYGEASGAIASFDNGSTNPLKSLEVDINPIQDLHGYDKPWAGGAGKNKFQTTLLTITVHGVTFTVNNDGTITISGTPSDYISTVVFGEITLPAGSYKVNGNAVGSASSVRMVVYNVTDSSLIGMVYDGNEVSFTLSESKQVKLYPIIPKDYGSVNGIVFKPMIRLATETNATFEPYSNICPISGRSSVEVTVAGTNVWDEETERGSIDNATGELITFPTLFRSKNKTHVVGGQTYYFASNYGCLVYQYRADDSYIKYTDNVGNVIKNFTVENDTAYIRERLFSNVSDPTLVKLSINFPSTDTSYHEYVGTTKTISLGQTVYGGKLNVTKGELTVDRAFAELDGSSDENWMIGSSSGHYRAYIKIDDIESYSGAYSSISQLYICSIFENGSWNNIFDGNPKAGMVGQNWGFGLDSFSITTDTELREWLSTNNIQIAYKLATPTTVSLTPTQVSSLLGNNNIWADSGDVDVVYITSDFIYNELRMNDTVIASNSFAYHSIESESATMAGHANTATTSTKLASDAGSNLNPVYFDDGVPVASIGNSVPFITGTGTVAGTWLGSLEGLTAYYDGLLILYKPSVAGASTTTLNINGLGAKTCYVNNTTKLTTHYPANQPILLVYSANTNSGCFVAVDNYLDGNTTPNALYYWNNTYAKTKLLANTVIVGDSSGYSTAAAGVQFDISYPILWTAAEVAQGSSNYASMFMQIFDRTLATIKSGFTSTAKKLIYLVVTITGNVATVDSSIITDTLPSTDDGKVYISLGRLGAQSTGANYFNFQVTHPMFWYKGGKIVPYGATDAQTVNGHTVNSDVPSNATFTDTTYTFANGTNGFTVTPSGGTAQTVTVTPSITNNVTGSGTSGYLAKFNGANTITNGAQLGSDTTKFLRNDGTWAVPPGAGVTGNNAGYHNSIYRGKSLGTSITTAQWNAISAGTFDDMYIGDYWTLSTTIGSTTSNIQYVIAGFDYWWNCGDSYPQSSNKHHVVLVPATNLYSAQMNATDITTGGYIGSAMYTTNLANARTGISTLFGNHLYSVRRLFTNSVNTVGQATGWAWATSSVDLMSETMVYGHPVWTTSGFEVGVDRTILPLFALNSASASIYSNWWLRSVATPSYFALVSTYGNATYYNASTTHGVRPAFAIC